MDPSVAVVIDLGSQSIRGGYSYGFPNEAEPRVVRESCCDCAYNSLINFDYSFFSFIFKVALDCRSLHALQQSPNQHEMVYQIWY